MESLKALPSPITMVLILLGCGLCYFLALSVYRLTLHPYAAYPGPLLAKISPLYSFYHAYKQDTHLDIWRCHLRYGDFVRYAPDRLSVNRLDAVKDIYGHGKNLQKGKFYRAFPVHKGAFNTHNSTDKTIHGRKRRVVNYGFSDAALKSAEPFMLPHIRDLTLQLVGGGGNSPSTKSGEWSGPKDMSDYAEQVVLDILTDLAFGESYHTLTSTDKRFALPAIKKHLHRQNLAGTYPELFSQGSTGWRDIGNWLLPGFARLRGQYVELGKQVASKTIEALESTSDTTSRKRKDILYYVVNAKDPETGSKFTYAEIFSEAALFLAAGGDTLSVVLSALLFYLARSPKSYAKLTEEIRTAFPDLASVRAGHTLASLPYLRACIDEAMRMSPPVGSALWRQAQSGGARITEDQVLVPDGYEVGVPTYALHHHDDIWGHDNFTFKPERWIASPDDPDERIKDASRAFMPFSVGPRGCLAKPLAYLELNLIIARVLYTLDFKLADPQVHGPEWAHLGEGGTNGWGLRGWASSDGMQSLGKRGHEMGRHREGEFQLYDQFTAGKAGPGLVWRIRDGMTREQIVGASS